ncbi:MAG: Na/Pi cotransporter family protein [Clostridia bacterium]|nr:Na/Pi cotransporter family protein [Clostridia bacterium]MBQ2730612.1 Na/Pi cotransporter family protein [Clostridia bacterium]
MLSAENLTQLIESLIWLLAGVGVFIVGMNFMSDALEKSAGSGMKRLLEKISNNRFSGVGVGAGVTAIIQSSSATTVMVIGLVNAGVMTLTQATPIIMGANVGTTVTGLLVALKNDYFNMLMYLLAFAGVMMGFAKSEKVKLAGLLSSGLGLIFVGLNVMSSEAAFGNPLVEELFTGIFSTIDHPLLLIVIGAVFTALIQSSSAATGVVITMVGTGVLPLSLALFIVLGANIGTCVTALLASVGANANSKRIALIHFTFNVIGTAVFTALIWLFRDPAIDLLISCFPGEDPMSLQMRVSLFHVVFNVTTTLLLLPFVRTLVTYSMKVIREKKAEEKTLSLRFVDDRLLSTPPVALMQVKKELDYMLALTEENISLSFVALDTASKEYGEKIAENEAAIDFINSALTKFLIRLSANVDARDEKTIGAYCHVLNDLERIGDHAENFHEIGVEMIGKSIAFSEKAHGGIFAMRDTVMQMFAIAKNAFEHRNKENLPELSRLEETVNRTKKELIAGHFARLAEGNCSVDVSPYYSSVIIRLERIADHLVNVGYSIVSPTGSRKDEG